MINQSIEDDYFEWLYSITCGERFGSNISYRKLLVRLHETDFRYSVRKYRNDKNRESDGKSLRRRFARATYSDACDMDQVMEALDGPCSVYEMMTALAIRCEEDIMDDPLLGNRTGQWFWGMIRSLGLLQMSDDRYDQKKVDRIIKRFLDRKYEPDGQGGLFTIKDCEVDLRKVEIWWQMCRYIDTTALHFRRKL